MHFQKVPGVVLFIDHSLSSQGLDYVYLEGRDLVPSSSG